MSIFATCVRSGPRSGCMGCDVFVPMPTMSDAPTLCDACDTYIEQRWSDSHDGLAILAARRAERGLIASYDAPIGPEKRPRTSTEQPERHEAIRGFTHRSPPFHYLAHRESRRTFRRDWRISSELYAIMNSR